MSAVGAVGARQRTFVEPERTVVTRGDLRDAIGRAYEKVTGKVATKNVLDTLTAHACLETGSGAHMYNHNFGGIKGTSPEGATARCRTKEVIEGREIEVRDGFRAYRTLDGGAVDYVRTMVGQFRGAVARAESGDIDGFAHALKQAHYYTADEGKYASALHALSGTNGGAAVTHHAPSATTAPKAPAASPAELSSLLDTAGFGRVLDAIACHRPSLDAEEDD